MQNRNLREVYAVKHIDDNVRRHSRSGGIFTAVSDYILQKNGVIYGCVLEGNTYATHVRAENSELRDMMRGSKYIQSDLRDTYGQVKKDLNNGRSVLFTGTSCQIDGLYSYLNKDYVSLFTVDIVCHGTPSRNVWEDYVHWQETRNKAKCVSVDFRNKIDFGWRAHIETLFCVKKGSEVKISSEVFKNLFSGHWILRPSCYLCPYKDVVHPGDITIADYWGIEKAAPGFDDNMGVSLVLINDARGSDLFDNIKSHIIYKKCRIEDSMQISLQRPFECPENRWIFWKDFYRKKFGYIAKHYGGRTCGNYIKKRIRQFKHFVSKHTVGR